MSQEKRQYQSGKAIETWFTYQAVFSEPGRVRVDITPHPDRIVKSMGRWLRDKGAHFKDGIKALVPTLRMRVFSRDQYADRYPWEALQSVNFDQRTERRHLKIEIEIDIEGHQMIVGYMIDIPSSVSHSFSKTAPMGPLRMAVVHRVNVTFNRKEEVPVTLAPIEKVDARATPNLDAFLEGVFKVEGVRIAPHPSRSFIDALFQYTPYENKYSKPLADDASVTNIIERCELCSGQLPARFYGMDASGARVRSSTRLGALRRQAQLFQPA